MASINNLNADSARFPPGGFLSGDDSDIGTPDYRIKPAYDGKSGIDNKDNPDEPNGQCELYVK